MSIKLLQVGTRIVKHTRSSHRDKGTCTTCNVTFFNTYKLNYCRYCISPISRIEAEQNEAYADQMPYS